MLVNSRRTLPEARHLGAYEVVFAAAQDSSPGGRRGNARPQSPPGALREPSLAGEMAEMRRQLTRMSSGGFPLGGPKRSAVDHHVQSGARRPRPDPGGERCGRRPRLLHTAEPRIVLGPATPSREVAQAFRKEIQNRFTVAAELSPWSFETAAGPGTAPARTIVALVGPPGVGKTTMLAKLAARLRVVGRRRPPTSSPTTGRRIAPS